jgi:hypothetical protein
MKSWPSLCLICLLTALSACTASPPVTRTSPLEETAATSTSMGAKATDAAAETIPRPTQTADSAADPGTEATIDSGAIEKGITFSKTFGGERRDRGINLLQTGDGGYAVVGYSGSTGAKQEDIYLVRTDPHGEVLWSKTYGGEGSDNGWAIMETGDGGFLITGFTNSYGAGEMDIYLLRLDSGGVLLWEKTYGGPESEYGWAMAPTLDGGYVLAGQTDSFGEGAEDGYLVKVNAQGEELWSQTFGGLGEDRLFSVDLGDDGGFILTGTTRSFGAGERDLYLVKTTDSGELAWTQVLGEERDDVGHAVRRTADGGYIVTGYTMSFGAANYDTWLAKFDESGNMLWESFYGDAGDDRAIYGEQTDDGGYILTGYTKSYGAIGWDVFLVRIDSSGVATWHKRFGGRSEDTGYTVRQTSDKGFILTGETYSAGARGGDMYLIKVNESGDIVD